MNTNNFNSREKFLKSEIKKIKKQLSNMPEGSIYCKSYGQSVKWFFYHDKQYRYFPKKERAKAEKLAVKKYLSFQLQEMECEIKGIEAYNKYYGNIKKRSEKLLENTDYEELLGAYFKPASRKFEEWSHEEYSPNTLCPENKVHKSISGNMLRSKSETIIDMLLFQNKIPYRYESPIVLDGKPIYPDFTILHPQSGKCFYWEHCGMIDNEEYRNSFLTKLDHYLKNGIYPHRNLILTFETSDHPLTSEEVMGKIEWLLSNS